MHTFLLQKRFERSCFVAKTIYTHFFFAKTIYALFGHKKSLRILFCRKKRFTRFFCRKNDLRTSSGKFLRVESCHPESSDFLGLWRSKRTGRMRTWGREGTAPQLHAAHYFLATGVRHLPALKCDTFPPQAKIHFF